MDNSSFWSDIKKFEDTLAKDPSSYCFAPLAELYRKTGLLEDAISTALKGTALHPEYVGGYMALGRAYLDKGLKAEALDSLQRVVSFTPEKMLAQKLLCQMYSDSGDTALLRKTLGTLLLLNPSDTESRLLLESLEGVSPPVSVHDEMADIRVELIPDDESVVGLEELVPLDDPAEAAYELPCVTELMPQPSEPAVLSEPEPFPEPEGESSSGICTATIAELYVAQGHFDLAVDMYRELLADAPGNREYKSRITELEALISCEGPQDTGGTDPWSAGEVFSFQPPVSSDVWMAETDVPEPITAEDNNKPLTALEGWLDSLRRARECRSARG